LTSSVYFILCDLANTTEMSHLEVILPFNRHAELFWGRIGTLQFYRFWLLPVLSFGSYVT